MLEIHKRHAYLEAENENALLLYFILFRGALRNNINFNQGRNCGTKRGGFSTAPTISRH